MLDLAIHWGEGPVLLRDIARRQNISLSYLEQLITPLVTAGIVRSIRGPRGGVSLAKHPQDIKMSEVIQILEGQLALVYCINNPSACERSEICVTRDIWDEVERAMNSVLESKTIQYLVERHTKKADTIDSMYFI